MRLGSYFAFSFSTFKVFLVIFPETTNFFHNEKVIHFIWLGFIDCNPPLPIVVVNWDHWLSEPELFAALIPAAIFS